MSGMAAFLIAVSGVSLVCYWLMTRAQDRGPARRSSSDSPGADSSYSGSSDGWSIFGWFGGDNSSSDNSGSSSGGDSGGDGGD